MKVLTPRELDILLLDTSPDIRAGLKLVKAILDRFSELDSDILAPVNTSPFLSNTVVASRFPGYAR